MTQSTPPTAVTAVNCDDGHDFGLEAAQGTVDSTHSVVTATTGRSS